MSKAQFALMKEFEGEGVSLQAAVRHLTVDQSQSVRAHFALQNLKFSEG